MNTNNHCPAYKLENCPIYYILKNQVKHRPEVQSRIDDLKILERELKNLQLNQSKYIFLLTNYQSLNDQYVQLSNTIDNNNTLQIINNITEAGNQISLYISRKYDIIEIINRILCILKTYLYGYLIKFENKKTKIQNDINKQHKITEYEGYKKKDTIIYLCLLNKLYDVEYICNRIQIAIEYAIALETIILN